MYLTWTSPTTPSITKTVSQFRYFEEWNEEARQKWLKEHYEWQVCCHCVSTKPIELVTSHTKNKTKYYLRNKNSKTLHGEGCAHEASAPVFLSFDWKNQTEWSSDDFEPQDISQSQRRALMASDLPTSWSRFEWFAREWLTCSLNRGVQTARQRKWSIPKSSLLYREAPLTLKQWRLNSGESLVNYWIETCRWRELVKYATDLQSTESRIVPLLMMGKIIAEGETKQIQKQDYIRLTLQTKKQRHPEGVSEIWCPLSDYLAQKKRVSITTEQLYEHKGEWWLVGGFSIANILSQSSVEWESFGETHRPIPLLTRVAVFPVASSSVIIDHIYECQCFNLAQQQQIFITKGYLPSIKLLTRCPQFYYYSPSTLQWEIGDIWRPTSNGNAAAYRVLKQESRELLTPKWKWTPFYRSDCPPFR